MSDTVRRSPSQRIHRLGLLAGWVAALACLPYLILKLAWTVDLPVGITDPAELDSEGWMAANAVMAVIQLTGLVLVLALIQPWGRRLPAWLIVVPAWVGTGLLFQVAVGAMLVAGSSAVGETAVDTGSYQPWVFPVVYASFAAEGLALGLAFACHIQGRWGQLVAQRTGDVVAGRRARERRPWPEGHLRQLASVVAGLCAAVAAAFSYWAVASVLGLSTMPWQAPWALQASRAAGAAVAAAGLLALAGWFGQATRLWLSVGLTWLGSGAMAAFDGLTFTLNRLFATLGAATSETAWSSMDTVLLLKVLIGLLAAAVGALALRVAARQVRETAPPQESRGRPTGQPRATLPP